MFIAPFSGVRGSDFGVLGARARVLATARSFTCPFIYRVELDKSEKAMEEGVNQCNNFVLLLTAEAAASAVVQSQGSDPESVARIHARIHVLAILQRIRRSRGPSEHSSQAPRRRS